ncbi:MAG: protein kinase domain-containing protein, partial [Planctomycetota bacterium]
MPDSPEKSTTPEVGDDKPDDGRDSPIETRAAPGSDEEGALVRLGVRFGFLSKEDGERALAARAEGSVSRAIGDVLVEEGFLGEEDLEMLSQILAMGSSATLEAVQAPVNRPAPGTQLGDFRIVRQIARGSMGVVYEAVQEPLNRRVALKVLPSELTRDERTIERFQREAGAAASLNHPGIVKVLSVGEEGGFHYYAMDMVRGKSLDAIIETERLPHRRVAEIIRDAAHALAYAHDCGVVHRDIKPGNIMVTQDGRVLIADFGLARTETTGTLTRSDEIVGTPMYMSPEQAVGDREKVDSHTDIYSLGATLYEALTLSPPYDGSDLHHILSQVIGRDPRPPRSVHTLIPRDLETVCLKAMEKDPEARFDTARAFGDDLSRFIRGDPIHARPPSFFVKIVRKARRNKPATALILILLLTVLAITGVLLGQSIRDREKIRSASVSAREAQRKGNSAFVEKMEALRDIEELEAKIGRVQESREKAELLQTIDRQGKLEEESYALAAVEWERILQIDEEHLEAHAGIAQIHLNRARASFILGKKDAPFTANAFARVEKELAFMEIHDVGGQLRVTVAGIREYISRKGTLDIDSRPPGASVTLHRVEREKDFTLGPREILGTTPLKKKDVPPGSYLVVLSLEGHAPTKLHVLVTHEHPNPTLGPVELFPKEDIPAGLIHVPGGEFLFGGRVAGASRDDRLNLPSFFLGLREVTYGEYLHFLNEVAREKGVLYLFDPFLPRGWGVRFGYDYENIRFEPPKGWDRIRRLPVWGIPQEGAKEFCKWMARTALDEANRMGAERYMDYRLPTEAEWEKGARGADGRLFPWGDKFDEGLCNNAQTPRDESSEHNVKEGGTYPNGASPFGIVDMAGNLAEWTSTLDATNRDVIVKGGDLSSG